jgi:serine protease AprX
MMEKVGTKNNFDIDLHNHEHTPNIFAVIPTAEKLNACRGLTGKGVTIAFLDSGFYPHPDFQARVIKFHDVSGEEEVFGAAEKPAAFHWHGTQTVTACAGDGTLSDGFYSGIASEAELVLVKVSENGGRIPDANIEKGLLWVIEHCEEYRIRIVNLSLGGDRDSRTKDSRINLLAEKLVKKGVSITAAAGNSAADHSIPPASSPSVITVGGYSDENSHEERDFELYHSSYGLTADGLIKPEIIAPAMHVAAPILPETEEYQAAKMLSWISTAPEYKMGSILFEHWHQANLPERILYQHDRNVARQMIDAEIEKRKLVSTHYQNVDGTSFAAPIVASVIAQMLETNPNLTPAAVKNILVSTAVRLAGHPAVRQGYGVLNVYLAVERSVSEYHIFSHEDLKPPYVCGNRIIFSYHDDAAEKISLVGDFNNWKPGETEFLRCEDGIWRAEIPCLPAGHYRYKFVVDGDPNWIEDPSHDLKESDGYDGFNSAFNIS